MKFVQRMIVSLAVMMALVFAGCNSKDQLQQVQTDREQLTKDVASSTDKMVAQIEEMKKENLQLRFAIENQDKLVEELARQVRNLQDSAGVQQQKIESEKTTTKGGNLGGLVSIIIVVLAVLIAVVLAFRFFRPRPLEDDEDEDFSSFDDDYGFDDEDDDFGFDDEEDAGNDADTKKDDAKE